MTELEAALRRGATVLDVREPMEYAQAHVPGAVPIPMGQLSARMGELDKAATVLVICATGNRSAAMTDLLTAAGYDASNVAVRAGAGLQPDWWLVLLLTTASAAGGYAGGRLAAHIHTLRLTGAFTALVLAAAVYTASQALPALL